jgi:hypothetical protein
MSSSPASCYTCSPKASSAFATSAFSPTGGAPLSCHFAGKPSQRFNRKPHHQPPPPRKPDRFGSVPTVAGRWWSSRGLRPSNSSSVRHPFSPEPPHETTVPSPPLGAPHHPQAGCALLALQQAICSQPRITIPLLPHANYNQTSPAFTLSNSSSSSRCLSLNPQNHSICINASPRAAPFKPVYRTRRRTDPTCTPAVSGAHPIHH